MNWAPQAIDTNASASNEAQEPTKLEQKAIASGSRRKVSLGTMFSQNQPAQRAVAAPVSVPAQHDHGSLAELLDYLSLPQEDFECDILDWWASREGRFPNLSRMARQYLGVLASSAAVERLCSASSS